MTLATRSQSDPPNRHASAMWAASYGGAKIAVGDGAVWSELKAPYAATRDCPLAKGGGGSLTGRGFLNPSRLPRDWPERTSETAASGMSAFGQDAEERLEAKPASPTAASGDAPKQSLRNERNHREGGLAKAPVNNHGK